MKNRHLIIVIAALILLSTLFCSCGYGDAAFRIRNGRTVPQLSEDKIETVRVWSTDNTEGRNMTEEEISDFTSLFNASKVKLVQGASTPDFGVQVTLKDGTVMSAVDEGSGRLEVQFKGESTGDHLTYINVVSEELWQFVKDCAQIS